MNIYRRHAHHMPGLNTASLPDLIFTVLFFFMTVTHMRKQTVKIRYQEPAGTELTRLTKKSTTTYIYIGQTSTGADAQPHIQLNDKFVEISEVSDYIIAERNRMEPEDIQRMIVSIKADKGTPMGLITDVKQALRHSNALKINYSAVEKPKSRQ